jgi:hypothetical protein
VLLWQHVFEHCLCSLLVACAAIQARGAATQYDYEVHVPIMRDDHDMVLYAWLALPLVTLLPCSVVLLLQSVCVW